MIWSAGEHGWSGRWRLGVGLTAIAASLFLFTTTIAWAKDAKDAMPAFELNDLNGRPFDASRELADKVTLIAFLRLGKRLSDEAVVELEQLHKDYAGQPVRIVAIFCGAGDRDRVKKRVEELKLKLVVLFDPDRAVCAKFKVIAFPTTLFVDAKGMRRFRMPGFRRDFTTVAKAHLDFMAGRISKAEHTAQAEARRAPPTSDMASAQAHYRMARKLLQKGKQEAAIEQFLAAWNDEPPVALAGVELGFLWLADNRNQEALKILDQATERLPDDPRALGAKGVALVRTDQREKGIPLLRQAVEGPNPEPLFLYEMGRINESEGDEEAARRQFKLGLERALGIQPQKP